MKFKVGDRVAVYNIGNSRFCGTITHIDADHALRVDNVYYSPKQCRRLILKKRREIWVYGPELSLSSLERATWFRKCPDENNWIRFVEAKKQ